MEKLEAFIKTVYSYIFKEDPAAQSKFLFVLDWAEANLNDYQHWSLFLTTRLTILLILEAFEEHLVMNVGNDQLIERNFQSFSYVLEKLRKLVPEHADLEVDSYERVKFKANFELPPSLTPYFKSDWADYLLYQKYLFLFKKFYCTDWYLWGLKNFQRSEQLLDYLMQTNVAQIAKESTYYMRNNFLPSLIEIHRAMVVEMKESRAK